MSSKDQLTRRDWFRLRLSKPNHDRLGADQQSGMKPVAELPNHDGLDLSELPPVHEALLAADQVRGLFSDLEHCATNVQLLVRGASADSADLGTYLRLTCDQLLSGKITKLQVRYEWQDARWIDTLEHKAQGTRIVRIRHG